MTWRQLSQPLAYVSKFPTLLDYKMMGITPLGSILCFESAHANSSAKLQIKINPTNSQLALYASKRSHPELRGVCKTDTVKKCLPTWTGGF